jgi:hypothetical protein
LENHFKTNLTLLYTYDQPISNNTITMLLPTWKQFILTHQINKDIPWSANQQDIIDLLNPSLEPLNSDEKTVRLVTLASCPAIILLSLDPFDHTIFSSFHHDHLKASTSTNFTNKDRNLIALTGFSSSATPVFINMDDAFTCTPTTYPTPTLRDFLSTHDKPIEDLKTITAVENHCHHIRKTIPLPPHLAHHITAPETWSSSWELLHLLIKDIANKTSEKTPIIIEEPNDNENDPIQADDTDDSTSVDSWDHALPYLPLFISLWAFGHHETIPQLTTRHTIASRIDASIWAQGKQTELRKKFDDDSRHNPSHRSDDDNQSTAASSIGRLQETLDAHARRFGHPDSDTDLLSPNRPKTSDDNQKSWKAIDESFRQAILFASSADGDTHPSEPSSRLLRLVQAKTGPTAARLLQRWHPRLDLCIQPGMALHISKAQLTSTPTPFAIDTFGPFFCAPTRAGFSVFSNNELNEFELYAQTFNISAVEIKKMTSCKPYVPTSPDIYISQVRNFDAILEDVLTKDSLLRSITTNVMIKHYELNEHMYYTIFHDHNHFGVWILNRLHFKVQSILHQCYQVDSLMDVDFLKFSMQQELNQIDTLSFQADAPTWYRAQLDAIQARASSRSSHNNNSGNRRNRDRSPSHRRSDRDSPNKRTRVCNDNIHPSIKLQQNEVYSKLIHFQNLTNCKDKAVKYKGDFLCNNYHIRGHCFDNCKRKNTHIQLPQDLATRFCSYVKALRNCRDTFEANRSGGQGRSQAPTADTNQNPNQGEPN